ncbi:MAG: redoxin domain-containing protein [Bryobacteraceae bacterium]
MKRTWALALALATAFTLAAQAPPKTFLKVGDMAPDFTLPSTQGKSVNLADFRGKKNVVLAFFPAAFTGGCTREMTAYGKGIEQFESADTQVFGISADNTPSQKRFAEDLKVTFPILSDFLDRHVMKEYGVLIPARGIANRTTFVVGKDGRIEHIEEGSAAIDISGAATACSRLAHKSGE